MRRFSQRNSLVTLNEINITPLLDLAFVLLIIFVITRPALEQSIDLNLPKGGQQSGKADPRDAMTVEISPRGFYKLNGRQMDLERDIFPAIQAAFQRNPNSYVAVRADQDGAVKHLAAVLDGCQKRKITRFQIKTFPER